MRRTSAAMEPLEQLRAKITDFPGYETSLERRRSDAYVRSYMGEALSEMAARCALTADLKERVDELTLRVAFADARAFPNHAGAVHDSTRDSGEIAAADAATIELADRAATIGTGSASRYLDEVTAALDRRDAAIRAALPKMP